MKVKWRYCAVIEATAVAVAAEYPRSTFIQTHRSIPASTDFLGPAGLRIWPVTLCLKDERTKRGILLRQVCNTSTLKLYDIALLKLKTRPHLLNPIPVFFYGRYLTETLSICLIQLSGLTTDSKARISQQLEHYKMSYWTAV